MIHAKRPLLEEEATDPVEQISYWIQYRTVCTMAVDVRRLLVCVSLLPLTIGRPNFLFLLTDDQDRDLGSFSVLPDVVSEIFNQGLNFTEAYVDSPKCCPSRTSLFTSRMAHNLGDVTQGWCGNFSAQKDNTFTTTLGAAGYAIGQFGKWYNEEPQFCKKGWVPEWKVNSSNSDFYVMCQEVKYYNMTWNDNGNLTSTGDKPTDYLTSLIGNRTMKFLSSAVANADTPWLAYVAIHAPHLPATPAPWYLNVPMGPEAPRTPNWNSGWEDKHFQIDNGIDKPMSQALINGSDALWGNRLRSLMSVNDVVVDIMALLKANPAVLANTYIIYTSDHGYHLGQHGVWSEKGGPYLFDARVPLAITGPGIAPGSVSSAMVSNVDLAPTILELAGVPDKWPDNSGRRDGTSLTPLFKQTSPSSITPPSAAVTQEQSGPRDPIPPPPGWRDRLLIQYPGWTQTWQWLQPCLYDLPGVPSCASYGPVADQPAGLLDTTSNCYTSLRVINSTHNTWYTEFRPFQSPLSPSYTNWTEVYNITADPFQITNLAVRNQLPPPVIAAMASELWDVANCVGASCP